MPRHRDFPSREEDPYRRINAWDDGHSSPNHNNSRSYPTSPPPYHSSNNNDHFYHENPPYYDDDYSPPRRSRSPSPRRRPPQTSSNQRPTLTRSKSTSAKAFAKEGLATIQQLSPHWQKAAKAAIQAGGMAALAQRKQPGDWAGMKGAKVATAALGAAAADVWAHRAKDKKNQREDEDRGGYDRRDRDRNRDRDRDRSRDRDRDYDRRDRDRDRSRDRRDRGRRDRSRDRDRDYDDRRDHRGHGTSKKRGGGGEMDVIGDMLGSFIMDQIAKRGSRARA